MPTMTTGLRVSLARAASICLTAPRKVNGVAAFVPWPGRSRAIRSEEHTSELQSRQYLVCRLLLEKKKQQFAHRFFCFCLSPFILSKSALACHPPLVFTPAYILAQYTSCFSPFTIQL